MEYRAPIADILLSLNHAGQMQAGIDQGIYADLADGFAQVILQEAGKFSESVLDPINHSGDRQGARLNGHEVTTADGWRPAYEKGVEGGWNG
ncbi:MAG: acyl-CoA dehydrogenase, partial [Hyphomicrobiales bacterium]|nr:acyl-CoA dehydrogenase [Hyphomicrobiales bacterium]